MRYVCMTLLAFLCGALLASVIPAQEPDAHYFSTRRGYEPQSNSVLTNSNVVSDVDSATSKDQWRSGNQNEIVHVALNYSTPPVKSSLIGQGTPVEDTVVYQAPVEIYEGQTFIQDLSTPFNPPVPADQLAGPTFGDTYFAGKHVDEWSGYCRMKSIQVDLCGWFYADCGCYDGCGANRHQPCGRRGCRSRGGNCDNGCGGGCSDSQCSHGQGRTSNRGCNCRSRTKKQSCKSEKCNCGCN